MKTFRFFWEAHKWAGLSIALILLVISGSGFLLLLKKEFAWIQPPTQRGEEGTLDEFLTLEETWRRVEALQHPDFKTLDDLDRIDVRPSKRVYKLRSKHGQRELQVDAITGVVLSDERRVSDWLERLHDGSLLGAWVHDYLMPPVALAVMFLTFSGCWLWAEPLLRRRLRARHLRREERV